MKLRFRDPSFVSGIQASNHNFVPNLWKQFCLEALFSVCYYDSNSKLFSCIEASISETKLQIWVKITSWNKTSRQNCLDKLATKLPFRNESFDFGNGASIPEKKFRFWKRCFNFYLETKDFFNYEANGPKWASVLHRSTANFSKLYWNLQICIKSSQSELNSGLTIQEF